MAGGDIGVYPMLPGQLPGAGPLLAKDCFSAQNDKNHPLEKRQSHSCAILILPVLAPIRDVHDVILGEGANLLDACSHTLPDEVTFEYLSPSIFRLQENAAYHFSNLVT